MSTPIWALAGDPVPSLRFHGTASISHSCASVRGQLVRPIPRSIAYLRVAIPAARKYAIGPDEKYNTGIAVTVMHCTGTNCRDLLFCVLHL
jgi:hypothetical protein